MTKPAHIAAHAHSAKHRGELSISQRCGCFHCLAIFEYSDISDWMGERESPKATAFCPKCSIDSVIGDASGFPITKAFLKKMRMHWFGAS